MTTFQDSHQRVSSTPGGTVEGRLVRLFICCKLTAWSSGGYSKQFQYVDLQTLEEGLHEVTVALWAWSSIGKPNICLSSAMLLCTPIRLNLSYRAALFSNTIGWQKKMISTALAVLFMFILFFGNNSQGIIWALMLSLVFKAPWKRKWPQQLPWNWRGKQMASINSFIL